MTSCQPSGSKRGFVLIMVYFHFGSGRRLNKSSYLSTDFIKLLFLLSVQLSDQLTGLGHGDNEASCEWPVVLFMRDKL